MDQHPLDNPVWNALGGRDVPFGVAAGPFRRYHPEIARFVAAEGPEELAHLADALPIGAEAVLITTGAIATPPGFNLVASRPLYHMVAVRAQLQPVTARLVPLTAAHVAEMMALVDLTKPGPFFRRTIEFGGYLGIFDGDRLVAMAGERKHVEQFSEVSAVCTHPDYRGRRYARQLVSAVAGGIVGRGEIPFLTTFTDNVTAIRTYEALGFEIRRPMHVTFVKRSAEEV